MARREKHQYVILTPKTDKGKARLGNHGGRWVFRGMGEMKFVRTTGATMRCMSSDGNTLLLVQETNDPDFTVQWVQR